MNEREINQTLWVWTNQHIRYQIPFLQYMPSEHDIVRLQMELKLSRMSADKNRGLLRLFLADEKYCKQCEEKGFKEPCYLNGKQKAIVVIDGDVCFVERDCKRGGQTHGIENLPVWLQTPENIDRKGGTEGE